MIKQNIGDILSLDRGILVHGCNCQGFMGAGIAAAIRAKWPAVYQAYRDRRAEFGLQLGDIIPVYGDISKNAAAARRHGSAARAFDGGMPPELIVVNAMTQYSFGRDGVHVDYDAVEAAFLRVKLLARDSGLPVHFPLIGCGLAGGDWAEVSARIERALGDDVDKTLWILPS